MYGYQYFSGANVVLEIEGKPVIQCAGISYEARESKIPVYGYSSRFFDAVARGQVVVQGTFIINYVHQDYLYWLLKDDRGTSASNFFEEHLSVKEQNTSETLDNLVFQYEQSYAGGKKMMEDLKSIYWPGDDFVRPRRTQNLHDYYGDLDIKITFGERKVETDYSGVTNVLLKSATILGRGVGIRIDEDTIVEEYKFFARNIESLGTGVKEYYSDGKYRFPGTTKTGGIS